MSIGEHLLDFQSSRAFKPAIITEDRIISYEDFIRNVGSIQQFLVNHYGDQSNIRIAVKLGNESAFLEVFFASVMLGYSCIPLDPKWTKGELNKVLESSKPNLIVNLEKYEEMRLSPTRDIHRKAEPFDIFYIGFTSGSTGTPKGFLRHHSSWIDSFTGCTEAFGLNNEEIYCAPGPLCHSLSLFAAVYAIHTGATLVLPKRFEATEIKQLLTEHNVTTLFVVPTMLQAMLDFDNNSTPIRSVNKVLSSGAKWDTYMKEKIKCVFSNAERGEFYGASETSFITYLDETGYLERPASVGLPFPGVKISIRDKKGLSLPHNEIGEVFITSTMIFSGYLDQPLTKPLTEMTVGDLGFIDEKGYITLVGRKKNMIISGGLNIYPEEIEFYLKRLDGIEEVVVTGVSDSYWGEKVVALIKWKQGRIESDSFLKTYCKQGLSSYKCPKEFYSIDDMNYTTSGKVARKAVINLYAKIIRK